MVAPRDPGTEIALRWWERRRVAALLALLATIPLLWPAVPPLADLPGHIANYRAELDYAHSPALQHFYGFSWSLVGNLGVNLLVVPLARVIGLEPAVKAVVLLIPVLTVAGLLWVAREVHGKLPPTALFVLPLAYNFPFLFGFVNFALAMALALLALALWLRLGRKERLWLRAMLFLPIACLLWLAHVYGWGMLCVTGFSAELVHCDDRGTKRFRAVLDAGLRCLPIALAIVPMILWRSGDVGGATEGWLGIGSKLANLAMPLRDRWIWLDLPSFLMLGGLLVWAWRNPRLAFSRSLGVAAILLFCVYMVLPQRIFGSGYADMRLYPYALALALVAIRPSDTASASFRAKIAWAGIAFCLFRLAVTSYGFWLYDRSFQTELAALDHVPVGARLVSFVGTPCRNVWKMTRLDHLPAMAVVRRQAFSNDQWSVPGAQLLQARYREGEPFIRDPSQLVRMPGCDSKRWRTLDESLRLLPRRAFDYVWLIAPPPYDRRLTAGMVPVWRSGDSVLLRIPSLPSPGGGDHAAMPRPSTTSR